MRDPGFVNPVSLGGVVVVPAQQAHPQQQVRQMRAARAQRPRISWSYVTQVADCSLSLSGSEMQKRRHLRDASSKLIRDYQNQPPETSDTFCLPADNHGIMERRRVPTSSMGCLAPASRNALKLARPSSDSLIHSRANLPLWISFRIFCMDFLVAGVMTRGPRVTSPYSAVSEML